STVETSASKRRFGWSTSFLLAALGPAYRQERLPVDQAPAQIHRLAQPARRRGAGGWRQPWVAVPVASRAAELLMDPAEQLGRQLDDAAPKRKPGGPVSRTFTLEEARALLPDVQDKAREFISLRADVTEVAAAMNAGARSSLGGMPEVKGWEARL